MGYAVGQLIVSGDFRANRYLQIQHKYDHGPAIDFVRARFVLLSNGVLSFPKRISTSTRLWPLSVTRRYLPIALHRNFVTGLAAWEARTDGMMWHFSTFPDICFVVLYCH